MKRILAIALVSLGCVTVQAAMKKEFLGYDDAGKEIYGYKTNPAFGTVGREIKSGPDSNWR